MAHPTPSPKLQQVIDEAKQKQDTLRVGGFIIVRWQDRYSWHATPTPQATLEEIVGFSTLADICCRYRLTVQGWQEISLEPSACT